MTKQLVVTRDSAGHEVLTLTAADGREPFSFESESAGATIPVLGTYDLLRIATFAKDHDFFVDEVRAVGVDGAPLDAEATDGLNDALLPELGDAQGAAQVLRSRYPGYTLVSLVLTTPSMHHIRLRRLGQVDTDSPFEAEASLRAAWHTLQLS